MLSKIEIDLDTFNEWFPDFGGVTLEQINAAYASAQSVISVNYGEIVLPEELQKRAVYVATAHSLYLSQNPQLASQGAVASASEGSVSASFNRPQFKNWLEYWLSLSPYGVELLSILTQVQPPMPRKPVGVYPYYNAGYFC